MREFVLSATVVFKINYHLVGS